MRSKTVVPLCVMLFGAVAYLGTSSYHDDVMYSFEALCVSPAFGGGVVVHADQQLLVDRTTLKALVRPHLTASDRQYFKLGTKRVDWIPGAPRLLIEISKSEWGRLRERAN